MQHMARHGERAQILPLLTIGIFAIMSIVALAVDVGYWRYQQRLEQSAADSAAVAGAIRLNYPNPAFSTTPQDVARAAAGQNNFVHNPPNVIVSVSGTPPAPTRGHATPYPANTAVEVIVQKTNQQFFSGIFGASFGSGSARSVAVAEPDLSTCAWQLKLDGGIGVGLTINGNKSLLALKCGVAANGTISVPGFDPTTTSVSYWPPNNPGGIGGSNPPNPAPLSAPANDPCVRLAGCQWIQSHPIPPLDGSAANGNVSPIVQNATAAYTVVRNCCASAVTNFPPGLYYLYTDGTSSNTISGALAGDGVTIVNVNTTFSASGLGVSPKIYFSAPSAPAPTAGVSYYQPPSNPNPITLSGGGNGTCAAPTSQFNGMFYAPSASITTNGGSIAVAYLVAGQVTLNGGGNGCFKIDPALGGVTSTTIGSPIHVVLAE